ncbi:MAG: hypothetical protein OEU26_23490, partial [Candidatus Tectomicrobia bacterium]|nr:hypothetical protein [Candidatus Tectomicrobia bacterium]
KRQGVPAKTSFFPGTRIYIVRAWKEQARKDNQTVTRYALEIPGTGQRWGYASAESLLDSLSMKLASG